MTLLNTGSPNGHTEGDNPGHHYHNDSVSRHSMDQRRRRGPRSCGGPSPGFSLRSIHEYNPAANTGTHTGLSEIQHDV